METTPALGAILVTLAVGAMSPGPSFLFTAQAALQGRRQGVAAALGMATGGALFALLALAGLVAVLERVPSAYAALRVAGGLYLLWLAWRMWRAARVPLAQPAHAQAEVRQAARTYLAALATQLGNPKTALVYASVFASLMPASPPAWFILALAPLAGLIEATWYTVVAVAFSAGAARRRYARAKAWVDRTAAGAFAVLGLGLLLRRRVA